MFAPKCGGCNRAIMENYISALNSQWHPDCFVCRVGSDLWNVNRVTCSFRLQLEDWIIGRTLETTDSLKSWKTYRIARSRSLGNRFTPWRANPFARNVSALTMTRKRKRRKHKQRGSRALRCFNFICKKPYCPHCVCCQAP